MDITSTPGDPLAQPTRAKIFALLAERRASLSTMELAEQCELHPNGIRVHLERLVEAGLVTREIERRDRGRPRDLWSVSADAQPSGDPPSGYADLARWLARALAEGGRDIKDIEQTGRAIGREMAAAEAGAPGSEARMFELLAAIGFQPRREDTAPGELTYCLRNCPFRAAVREQQPVICGLHRGMTQGMIEQIEPDSKLTGFVMKDPDTAGCTVEISGPLAES